MTANRDLKALIRERQSRTGESYSIARMHVMNARLAHPTESETTMEIQSTRSLDQLLELLQVASPFRVAVRRSVPHGRSANLHAAQQQAEELRRGPSFIAETGGVEMFVSDAEQQLLLAAGAMDQEVGSIVRNVPGPDNVFSARLSRCGHWVLCGPEEREDACFCGSPYRVTLDGAPGWSRPRGMVCCLCGGLLPAEVITVQRSPWTLLNTWQRRCNPCTEKARRIGAALADFDLAYVELPAGERAMGEVGTLRMLARNFLRGDVAKFEPVEALGHYWANHQNRPAEGSERYTKAREAAESIGTIVQRIMARHDAGSRPQ